MQIIPAFVTQNPLYQQYTRIPVRKLVLHSVGCPQPSAAVFARQWQTARYFAHAVLQADGTVYQVVPWDCRLMHVGAANAYSIGVEMTEPDCIRYTSGATFVCSDRARALAQVTARITRRSRCSRGFASGLDLIQTKISSRTRRRARLVSGRITSIRSTCGGSSARATRWTGSGATSPRRWQRKIERRCQICRAMIPWRRCRNGHARACSG